MFIGFTPTFDLPKVIYTTSYVKDACVVTKICDSLINITRLC